MSSAGLEHELGSAGLGHEHCCYRVHDLGMSIAASAIQCRIRV